MSQAGPFNPEQPIESAGIIGANAVFYNQGVAELYEAAVRRGEGQVAAEGPLQVTTAPHTGRSAGDKFIVRDASTETAIWWDNNNAMSQQAFAALNADMTAFAAGRDLFVQDLHGGADPAYRLRVRVITELAWHGLFIRHLLRRPELSEVARFVPDLTILNLPSFKADPLRHGSNGATMIGCDFANGRVLIAGTRYAGETKKAVFTTLNHLLPERGVLPMHCSANAGQDQSSALFFGLSGTGKTTLSSDPSRVLIGDDEHGWSEQGLFNFEGGCYAKTIRLSQQAEPQIYATTRRFGSVLENVVIDPQSRIPDFNDASLTENGRVAYPMDFIANASTSGIAPHPRTVIMLTADAFGVLPPIARLTPAQAMYHFLSGYTAKVAVKKNPNCRVCGPNADIKELIDYEAFCGVPSHDHEEGSAGENWDITVQELAERVKTNHLKLVDVREPHELEISHLPNATNIPLGQLAARLSELDSAEDMVLFCKSGARSTRALELLTSAGFKKVKNLKGGINAWAREVDTSLPIY